MCDVHLQCLYFPHPICSIIFALFFQLPLIRTQIQGHVAGAPPPPPARMPSFLAREEFSLLPSSTHVELCIRLHELLDFTGTTQVEFNIQH